VIVHCNKYFHTKAQHPGSGLIRSVAVALFAVVLAVGAVQAGDLPQPVPRKQSLSAGTGITPL